MFGKQRSKRSCAALLGLKLGQSVCNPRNATKDLIAAEEHRSPHLVESLVFQKRSKLVSWTGPPFRHLWQTTNSKRGFLNILHFEFATSCTEAVDLLRRDDDVVSPRDVVSPSLPKVGVRKGPSAECREKQLPWPSTLRLDEVIMLEPDNTIHGPIKREPKHDAGGLDRIFLILYIHFYSIIVILLSL